MENTVVTVVTFLTNSSLYIYLLSIYILLYCFIELLRDVLTTTVITTLLLHSRLTVVVRHFAQMVWPFCCLKNFSEIAHPTAFGDNFGFLSFRVFGRLTPAPGTLPDSPVGVTNWLQAVAFHEKR
jgi:hypothetical protein